MATSTQTAVRPKGLAAVFVESHAGHDFGHNCQLSKKRRIRVCTDPNHARDAALLRKALIVVGTLADPQSGKARTADDKPKPDRGRCGVCGRRVNVGMDGRLYKHTTKEHGDIHCDGSYGTPVAEEKVT